MPGTLAAVVTHATKCVLMRSAVRNTDTGASTVCLAIRHNTGRPACLQWMR